MLKIEQTINKVNIHLTHVDKHSFKGFNWIPNETDDFSNKSTVYLEIKGENTFLEEKEEAGIFLTLTQAIELKDVLQNEINLVFHEFEKALQEKSKEKFSVEEECNA